MKNILLFVILTLTMNGFAQVNPVHQSKFFPNPKSIIKMPDWLSESGKGKTLIPVKDLAQMVKLNARDVTSGVLVNDSIYHWDWDTNVEEWALESKITDIAYNADYYPTSLTMQNWTGSAWVNINQVIIQYNADNYETSEVVKEWTGTAWRNYYQELYTYDANDNLITTTSQLWSNNAWVNGEQTVRTYNANGQLSTELNKEWNGTSWDNTTLYTYTYDANKNLIEYLSQTFNDVDLTWENYSRVLYTYDASNRVTSYTYQNYDANSVVWNDLSRSTYTYNANDNLATVVNQYWGTVAWVNSSQSTYTYDANDNLTDIFTQSWNTTNWDNAARTKYTYNADNLQVKSVSESWTGFTWVRSNLSFTTYGEDDYTQSHSNRYYFGDPDVVSQGDSTYNFFRSVSGVNNINTDDSSLTIYPNPSSGKITISTNKKLGSLSVYNILGGRIYTNDKFKGQPSAELDLSNYGAGLYLITTFDGTSLHTRKIMMQ